ncbi:hypothetical protein C2G38_2060759, partial [Gigaspora rosea]
MQQKFHHGLIDIRQFMILQKFRMNLNFYLEAVGTVLKVKYFISYVIIYLALW